MPWFIDAAFDVLVAAAIIVGAFWISGMAKRAIQRTGERYEQLDDTLFGFAGSLARWAILAVAAIFVLERFGVETTSLVALIGAAGLAIGLALQGTLSNLAAGVMLLVFRPFRVGDFVEAGGHAGTVKSIDLFTTEYATPDNVKIIVPNGDIWAGAITNYSANATRRVDFTFGVSYASDLKKAETILRELIDADDRIHQNPEPFVKVTNLGDSSVDFTVRVWCDAGDYWGIKFDMTRAAKDAFDAGGIDIPFPTQTVIRQA
ncbi:MAG: mechanosensitive ion channel family protein [Rubricella sp.]